ncbi:MAG: 5'/3'-nucleotidase SurE [Clostridia bacterium]|nr:5'/3'-nucleotidase SurE [Clostridia bacterium]
MKILITNDDGIFAEGIRPLTEWAKKLGEVTVVAPKVEQSGKSHAIDFTHPLEIKKVEYMDGVEAWSLDSTPADCVRFGFAYLGGFDLVLSGINKGVNLGQDLVYSGTVGAIFEAARMGGRGIAISTYPDTLDYAKAELDRVWSFISEHNLLKENQIYNVNIPMSPVGIKVTKQGSPYFSDEFKRLEGDMFLQYGSMIPDTNPEDTDRDTNALLSGFISVTPLSTSRTNMQVFEKFKDI